MFKVIVKGLASNKTILFKTIDTTESNTNLLNWLRNHNIPIASSCNGEGICRKCIVNNDLLSCKVTLKQVSDHNNQILIEISYL